MDSNNRIDAHVHVWGDDYVRYPFAPEFTPSNAKPVRYLPEQIEASAKAEGVGRIVLVQMSYYGLDNRFLLDVIRRNLEQFRGIAAVDPNANNPSKTMRHLAGRGVRGFRIAAVEANSSLDQLQHLEEMFSCGTRESLALCFLINPELIPQVERFCARYPDTPVVVDHLARIGMAGPIQEPHVRSLCRLARYPNTMVKVSAFYALGTKRPPHEDLAPLIRRVYDAFGAHRLMWGSDCPFQTVDESYHDSISVVTDGLPFLSDEDQDWILRRTAESVFFR